MRFSACISFFSSRIRHTRLQGDWSSDVCSSDLLLWVGCVAGALEEQEYKDKLAAAGFAGISIEPTRVYSVEDSRSFLVEAGVDVDVIASQIDGKFTSAFIRATKPAGGCCTGGCCGGTNAG